MHRPEQKLHISVVAFLGRALPPEIVLFHPANGGKRTKPEASLLKAMGVLPGVPDLVAIMPNGQAAFIELKAPGGQLSPEQAAVRTKLLAAGCAYAVCRTLDEVEATITRWLAAFGLKPRASLIRGRAR